MQIIKDMPACVSGATFDWPQVVFETADQAGNAVAVALQDATCTFTVVPPTPRRPPPRPSAPVAGIQATAGDGEIELPGRPGRGAERPGRRLQGPLPRRRGRLDRIDRGRLARSHGRRRGPDQRDRVQLRGRRDRPERPRVRGRRVRDRHPDRDARRPPASRSVEALNEASASASRPQASGDIRVPLRVLERRRRDLAGHPRCRVGRPDCPDRRPDERHRIRLPRVRREHHRPERRVAVSDAFKPCGSRARVQPDARAVPGGPRDRAGRRAARGHRARCPRAARVATCWPWSTSSTPPTSGRRLEPRPRLRPRPRRQAR